MVEGMSIIIGDVTNPQTVEQVAEAYHKLESLQHAVRCERMTGAQAPLPDIQG